MPFESWIAQARVLTSIPFNVNWKVDGVSTQVPWALVSVIVAGDGAVSVGVEEGVDVDDGEVGAEELVEVGVVGVGVVVLGATVNVTGTDWYLQPTVIVTFAV